MDCQQTLPHLPDIRLLRLSLSRLLLMLMAIVVGGVEASAQEPAEAAVRVVAATLCEVPAGLADAVRGSKELRADQVAAFQTHVGRVVRYATRAVVGIETGASSGSGVIINAEGLVLTAGHVIRDQKEITIRMPDGTALRAKTLGSNQTYDTGMAQITDPGPHPFTPIGTSNDLLEGAWCLSLGQPLGFDPRRTPPVRLGRVLRNPAHALQTDCTIVSGDSGGPLFDLSGRVIGIHSRIGSSLTENIHVPIADYITEWEALVAGKTWGAMFRRPGDPDAPYLGARPGRGEGAVLGMVIPSGPADRAGLKDGDQIVSFGAVPIRSFTDVLVELGRLSPGDAVLVEVMREGVVHVIDLVLGHRGSASLPVERRESTPSLTRSRKTRALFDSVVSSVRPSTVRIRRDGFTEPLAFGAVVDSSGVGSSGVVVTKASELEEIPIEDIRCVLPDGRELEVRRVAINEVFDLALLAVDETGLLPVEWSDEMPQPGAFLVSPLGPNGPPKIGVLSSDERHYGSSRAFMGVTLGDLGGGAEVRSVVVRTGADLAGLKPGDVIVYADGAAIDGRAALQAILGRKAPGDSILLVMRREDQRIVRNVELGEREQGQANRRTQAIMGDVSRRRSDFPGVVQHDTVLVPNQCGGPVCDLDGKVLGINIARSSRVESYFVPARAVVEFLKSAAGR